MPQFRPRLIAAVLALVSIGLLASLLPRTSFVPNSSGEVVDAIGPVWPSFAVEQAFRDVPGVISEVRIWAAAGFDRGEAPIAASLLRGADGEPVRQVKLRIRASKLLVPYVLAFPPYRPEPGEKLVLQLWVSTDRENSVIFGTTDPRGDVASPTLYGRPTDHGPLAYEVIWRGTGWRAALEGSTADLARLVGAIAAAALAAAITVLSHPFISRTLQEIMRRVRTAFLSLASRVQAALRLSQDHRGSRTPPAQTPAARRGFYVFPWLIPAFAILHYLSNNLLLFRVTESISVFVVAMMVVTAAFLIFRLVSKTAAVAAVLTGLLGIAFFSYGHMHIALGDHADDRYLLGLGVPTVLALGALIVRRPELAHGSGAMLNFASIALVVVPSYQIAFHLFAGISPRINELSQEFTGLDERIAEAKTRLSRDELRDIYYIILDEYPRSGSPPEFDNSDFIRELERRGFYVASQARSNYLRTHLSIPSSLNISYLDEVAGYEEFERIKMADDHILGRILKALGYRYVHVGSGHVMTSTSRHANLVVDFAPSGILLSGAEAPLALEETTRLSSEFTNTFLRTTAAEPFLSKEFDVEHDGFYHWANPFRTLAWLDFIKRVGTTERPKFVFAHLLKPHSPHSFDRFGAMSMDLAGWSDDHDPTVSSAFYGQIIWLNARMLEVIDSILDDYDEPPIIVIAGDHGHAPHRNDILAAFLLPDGGASAVYPSITSVNHFRAILDYYFGLDLGLLEDRVYHYER